MTEFEPGNDGPGGDEPPGRDSERVAQLLADLADDPDAPPSSVTAMSVIAAARAAASASVAPTADRPAESPDPANSNDLSGSADVIEFRPRRRRFALVGLLAAASLAGISALVISLTVTGGSSTSTSADGARAVSAQSAGALESAAAAAVAPPAASAGAPFSAGSALAPEAAPQADAAAGGAQDNSAAAAGSAAAGSGPAADTAAAGCWPTLSDGTLAALTGALPPGAFGSPQPLTADCEPAPIGGVIVPGTAPGTALVVRVSAAVPGACISDTSIGTACVARGDDVYLARDDSGSPVVFAYGNGDQIVISGWPGAGDSVALPSGLTAEQSVAAANAVLGALN